mmetsp:Transcript_12755/g.33726  ORF Transcript_12755/g.33726 Transcript_12755/m.33726 type:complete len:263 (-) Transcript_12755:439-1227(-)
MRLAVLSMASWWSLGTGSINCFRQVFRAGCSSATLVWDLQRIMTTILRLSGISVVSRRGSGAYPCSWGRRGSASSGRRSGGEAAASGPQATEIGALRRQFRLALHKAPTSCGFTTQAWSIPFRSPTRCSGTAARRSRMTQGRRASLKYGNRAGARGGRSAEGGGRREGQKLGKTNESSKALGKMRFNLYPQKKKTARPSFQQPVSRTRIPSLSTILIMNFDWLIMNRKRTSSMHFFTSAIASLSVIPLCQWRSSVDSTKNDA